MQKVAIIAVCGLGFHWTCANTLLAQCELQKFMPTNGEPRAHFGFSLDISGDLLVVGAPNNTTHGPLGGAAYVYQFNGSEWVQGETLHPGRTGPAQMFGTSVSTFGDTIMVGVPNAVLRSNLPMAGAVYPYRFNGIGWDSETMVVPLDSYSGQTFGWSIDVGDDVAIVGAPSLDAFGAGTAYILRFDGAEWVEEAELDGADEWIRRRFGWSVGLDGNVAVIGGYRDGVGGDQAGSAYVFRYDGSEWLEEAKLASSDLWPGDQFGRSAAISGDTILVGAPTNDDNGNHSGSAYVFRYDGAQWVEEAKLLPTVGAPHEYFGFSVALSGDTAVVSAHFDGGNGPQSGAAYVFHFDGANWTQQAKLTASDGADGDYLGRAVAVSASTILLAAPRDDDQGTRSGSAYVYGVCPNGSVALPQQATKPGEGVEVTTMPVASPARREIHTVMGGIPGMGAVAAARVSEESYTRFLDESLQTHYGDERGTWGPELYLAQEQIAATLIGYGLTVTLEPFNFAGETLYNVVGTKLGSTYPEEEYIVGAHYDSVSNGGVDDNASGVALMLEAARVLSQYDSQRTMRFIAFSAEEEGLVGSHAYVADHFGDNIFGVISTDMVAYNDGENRVRVGCGNGSPNLKADLEQAVWDYGAGLFPRLSGRETGTDHYSFETAGYQGCAFSENSFTPTYHGLLDNFNLTGHLDYAYAAQLTRIIVGYLVDQAGVDTCAAPEPITVSPEAPPTNRFISFTPSNTGLGTAIRVKLVGLNHPDPAPIIGEAPDFSALEGEYRWVGPPVELPEFAEVGPPFAEPTWVGAMLQCEPYFADWTSMGTMLHVYGAEIMPDSSYEVQEVFEVCTGRLDDESLYSTAVQIDTARWGDVVSLYAGPANPPQPDFNDISAIVAKFSGSLLPTKVAALLRFNVLPVTEGIDFRDIAACVEGFVGAAYPYDGPCVCPSAATCPDLDVCGRCSP